jgi:hypothetical protein
VKNHSFFALLIFEFDLMKSEAASFVGHFTLAQAGDVCPQHNCSGIVF